MIELRIPGLVTKTPNGSHGHWYARARRAKADRQATRGALRLGDTREMPAPPLEVTLVRCAPHFLDDDNLASSFKNCRDGVADFLGIDDRDPRITWRVEQRKVPRKEQGTIIRIEGREGCK